MTKRIDDKEASSHLVNLITEIFNKMRKEHHRKISVREIALFAVRKIDPKSEGPYLLRFSAKRDLEQQARAICRDHTDKEEATKAQGNLFELQDYYPTYIENKAGEYVALDALTYEQGLENVKRLRNTGQGYLAHANALEAYINLRVSRGELAPMIAALKNEARSHSKAASV